MEETSITIHGSRCMVLGYGRIGKVLSKVLDALGARVAVAARGLDALAWVKVNGLEAVDIKKLTERVSDQDIIFNTIPCKIVTEDVLEKVRGNALIVDLASKPGGGV